MSSRAALPALALLLAACAPAPAPTASPASSPAGASPGATATVQATPAATPAATGATSGLKLSLDVFARVPGPAIAMTTFGDGSGRLLVASQDGRLWLLKADGSVYNIPFLDIRARLVSGGEQGLLGVAVHPDFPKDPRVFVDYTDTKGDTVVSSFTVDPATPDAADPHSERIVLAVDQPFDNHNGGDIHFGPDGMLYIGLGDGGDGGDPFGNGQNLQTLLGKILRIDVDHTDGTKPYSIPAGNPYAGRADARPEIWLSGVRNPWRYSFDPKTGDLWIGDVGQEIWEEVDVIPAGTSGQDLGWNVMEGAHCFKPSSGCSQTGLTLPIAEYSHAHGCAIIGGAVYRGTAQARLAGVYVFTDLCGTKLLALDAATAAAGGQPTAVEVGDGMDQPSAFGVDEAGELYLLTSEGQVRHVVVTGG